MSFFLNSKVNAWIITFYSRVDDEEDKFEARGRVYKVKKGWSLEIAVDEENYGTKVYRVHSNGEKEALEATALKTYSIKSDSESSCSKVKELLQIANTTVNTAAGAANLYGALAENCILI